VFFQLIGDHEAMAYKRNVNELEWAEVGHGERFHNQRKMLTPLDQAYVPKLGVSLFRLRPGKCSFPFHEHMANDEAILVTRGHGTLRYGDEQIALAEGDYVHLPAASGNAHHVINTSEEDLEYYCFSSMVLPDIVLYPDSNKIGMAAPKTSAKGERELMVAFLRKELVDYWEGEKAK
jgi:uncharacterized cupin superfamily protein